MRIAFNRERKHYDPVYFFSPLGRAQKGKEERKTHGWERKKDENFKKRLKK